jgi:hypothetical protein
MGRPTNPAWTDADNEKLRAMSQISSIAEIARALGRSDGSVFHQAKRLGIDLGAVGRKTKRPSMVGPILKLVPLLAAVPVLFLAIDKWNQTIAIIELAGPADQIRPLNAPLLIINPSNLFDMLNVQTDLNYGAVWAFPGAQKQTMVTDPRGRKPVPETPIIRFGSPYIFDPGAPRLASTATDKDVPVDSAKIHLRVIYETRIMGFSIPRETGAVFTLLKGSSGSQWVKGDQ